MPDIPSHDEIITTLTDALAKIKKTQRLSLEKGDEALKERIGFHDDVIRSLKDYASGHIGADLFLSMFDPKTYGLKESKPSPSTPTA